MAVLGSAASVVLHGVERGFSLVGGEARYGAA